MVNSMCLAGRLWTKGCLGAAKRRHAHGLFLRKQPKKTIFSEFICSRSNDAPESAHSLDVCRMCQRGKCFRKCLVETTFHQAVMRLLSMKYHISSRHRVGFLLMQFYDLLSDSIKMLTTVVVKKGPRVLGSCWALRGEGVAFPLLIITTLSTRLLCQNGMWEVWHPSCKPSWAPLVCLTIHPVFVRPAIGRMCQGVER